jgi:hypothetical protein
MARKIKNAIKNYQQYIYSDCMIKEMCLRNTQKSPAETRLPQNSFSASVVYAIKYVSKYTKSLFYALVAFLKKWV